MSHQVSSSQVHLISYSKTPTKISLVAFFSLPYCHYDKIYAGKGSTLPATAKFFMFKANLGENEGKFVFIVSKTQHRKALTLT